MILGDMKCPTTGTGGLASRYRSVLPHGGKACPSRAAADEEEEEAEKTLPVPIVRWDLSGRGWLGHG